MFGGSAAATDPPYPIPVYVDVGATSQPTNGPWMAGDSLPGARVLGTRGVPPTLNLPGQIGECSDALTDPDNKLLVLEAAWIST